MKISKFIAMAAIVSSTQTVFADAFKCTKNGKTAYQEKPCDVLSSDNKVKIKTLTPEQAAMAMERKSAVERDLQEYNLTKARIAKEQAQANLAQAAAAAQNSIAETSRRNSEALQRSIAASSREAEARTRYWDSRSGYDPKLSR